MERKEVIDFMKRVKSHYQEFVIDEYKTNEWYEELKKYDLADINRKLEQHLKSEEYGKQIPKLYFITNYLKTIKEKVEHQTAYMKCRFCNTEVNEEEFDKHYERCMRIDYIYTKADKHSLNIKSDLYSMKLDEIDEVYYKVIERIKNDVPVLEKMLIKKILETR